MFYTGAKTPKKHRECCRNSSRPDSLKVQLRKERAEADVVTQGREAPDHRDLGLYWEGHGMVLSTREQ